MSEDINSTLHKALEINLDPHKYGTIAEIGAGQEIARFFFQAGGAAGTLAKTMSAYDMQFSDAIYGEEENGRYVSRSRLEKMLETGADKARGVARRTLDKVYRKTGFLAGRRY